MYYFAENFNIFLKQHPQVIQKYEATDADQIGTMLINQADLSFVPTIQ